MSNDETLPIEEEVKEVLEKEFLIKTPLISPELVKDLKKRLEERNKCTT